LPFWWIVTPVIVSVVCLGVLYGLLMRWYRLTRSGVSAFRYLNGLRMFLEASEADRMAMVQGEATSERRGDDLFVPIFEKLLPYAIALGIEDSWQRAVGTDLEPEMTWLPSVGGAPVRLMVADFGSGYDLQYTTDNASRGSMGLLLSDWGDGVKSAFSGWGSGSDGGGSSGWSSGGGGGWSGGGSSGGGFSGGGGGGGGGGGW
ncbi:MAG: DUF2207 family protein, partial [Propioniciclava sp.]